MTIRPRLAFTTTFLPRPIQSHSRQKCSRKLAQSNSPTPTAVVVLAPGQGAQVLNMGDSWRNQSHSAAQVFQTADQILCDHFERPLSDYIFAGLNAHTLSRTDIAQPAIFVTSIACWEGMKHLSLVQPHDLSVTAGLSLGEYTALTIAGAIQFEDALRLVSLRGKAMQEAADTSDGGMLALLGADEQSAYEIIDATKQSDILVAANFNAPGQVVLSGSSAAIDRAAEYASGEKKLRIAKLQVAGAFHSPLMQPAAERLATALQSTTINLPNVPVMSNVTGEPHVVGQIRNMLVSQLTSSVRWANCCDYIRTNYPDASWTELAPGKTLSGIMRKIDRKVKIRNLSEAPAQAKAS